MEDGVSHSLVAALRAVPSLRMLDDRTLLAIVGDSANLFWRADSHVFAKGSPADGLYIVVSGSVRVLGDGGVEVGVLRAGDFFGELSLLQGAAHGRDVVAAEDTELMVVAKECFDNLVERNPEVARSIRETAAMRGAPAEGADSATPTLRVAGYAGDSSATDRSSRSS
jgi:CRP/FNR family transcriptional regulator, cyclic AMP receptor protein